LFVEKSSHELPLPFDMKKPARGGAELRLLRAPNEPFNVTRAIGDAPRADAVPFRPGPITAPAGERHGATP
jgi:hypothetical protein